MNDVATYNKGLPKILKGTTSKERVGCTQERFKKILSILIVISLSLVGRTKKTHNGSVSQGLGSVMHCMAS